MYLGTGVSSLPPNASNCLIEDTRSHWLRHNEGRLTHLFMFSKHFIVNISEQRAVRPWLFTVSVHRCVKYSLGFPPVCGDKLWPLTVLTGTNIRYISLIGRKVGYKKKNNPSAQFLLSARGNLRRKKKIISKRKYRHDSLISSSVCHLCPFPLRPVLRSSSQRQKMWQQ